MKHLRNVIFCHLLAAATAVLVCTALWLRTLDHVTAELPKAVDAAIAREGAATRQMVAGQIQGIGTRADWRLTAIQHDLFQRVDTMISSTQSSVDKTVDLFGVRSGQALDQVAGMRADLRPTLVNAAALEARYTALPDQIGATLRPSWLKLEPEITCKLPDGSGYGGCWHSRITGLFGEAVKVGGVFTQRFPEFVDSAQQINRNFASISGDASRWTHKWLDPKPMKTGDYFKAAGKITLGLGTAGLRGGVF